MTAEKTIDLRGKVGDWGQSADLPVRDRWAERRGDSGVQSAETRDETLSRSLQAGRQPTYARRRVACAHWPLGVRNGSVRLKLRFFIGSFSAQESRPKNFREYHI
jgi:hypothetical protein